MVAAVNLRFEYNQYVLYEGGDRNADNIRRIFQCVYCQLTLLLRSDITRRVFAESQS